MILKLEETRPSEMTSLQKNYEFFKNQNVIAKRSYQSQFRIRLK